MRKSKRSSVCVCVGGHIQESQAQDCEMENGVQRMEQTRANGQLR